MNRSRRGFCRALAGLGCLGLGACKIEMLVELDEHEGAASPYFPELPPQIPDQLANADASLRKMSEAMLAEEIPLLREGSLRQRQPGDPQVVGHFIDLMVDMGLQPAGERGGWLQSVPFEVIEPTGAEARVVLRPETEPSPLGSAQAEGPPASPEAPSPPEPEPGPSGDSPPDGDSPPKGEASPEQGEPPTDAEPPSRALELGRLGAFRQRSEAKPLEALPLSPLLEFETPLPTEVIIGRVALFRAPKEFDLEAQDASARVDLLMAAVRDAGAIGCLLLTRAEGAVLDPFRDKWRRQIRRAGSGADGLLIEGLLGADLAKPLEAALETEGPWVLDVDLASEEFPVESNNVIGRVIGNERPDEAIVLTCTWDTSSPERAALETQRLIATLAAFHQLAEWSRRSTPPRYSLTLLLTVDAGLAAGEAVHASWSADYGAETRALVALDRPNVDSLPAIQLAGRYDASIAELTRRVVAADNRDLLLVDQLEMASLAPYLRHPAPLICVGAPSPEALDDRARDGGDDEARTSEPEAGPDAASEDPDAALFADVRLLRNLVLALAAAH